MKDKMENTLKLKVPNLGLTSLEVQKRLEDGLYNKQVDNLTRSVEDIIKDNVFTLFNILNLILASIILFIGDWKNALFIGVAISNTLIGIFQELRFKKTIDNLSILVESKVSVLRDGVSQEISHEELVIDDIFVLSQGKQVPTDGLIVHSEGLEIDESLLTGEADHIRKNKGDRVLSGSFVSSGLAYVRVTSVGKDNFANRLSMEAKEEKDKKSKLMKTLDNIIKVLTIIIVPIGLALFYSSYSSGNSFRRSILAATAAMLGMIPEGLILLTSISFAVGAINLAKHKTLVQSLPSIETLARADLLCLDKTGTITDGKQSLEAIISLSDYDKVKLKDILGQLVHGLDDSNPTALAIKKSCNISSPWPSSHKFPFSSSRKWSGISFREKGSFFLGAPEFLFSEFNEDIEKTIEENLDLGFRVLALGQSPSPVEDKKLPEDLELIGLILISDNLRPNAKNTFEYFEKEGVGLKVISGDNPLTVSRVASQANISQAHKYIDLSKYPDDYDFTDIVMDYTIFGRVSPYQKRELVRALQANKKTVCMTGDGVNDVLALKEADCAVSMVNASDAARSVADFVLMEDDFGSMVEVLKEGRRVINNIENVSSLYLIKTIYSTILSLLFIFLPFTYPFSPLQMTPINGLTVGIPSFFLALESNYKKPEGRFIYNVLENSLPAALTVIINIILIQLAARWFGLSFSESSTMVILLTGAVGFIVLIKVAKPLNWKKNTMIGLLIASFLSCFIFLADFFDFTSLLSRNVFFYLPLLLLSRHIFYYLNTFIIFLKDKIVNLKSKFKDET